MPGGFRCGRARLGDPIVLGDADGRGTPATVAAPRPRSRHPGDGRGAPGDPDSRGSLDTHAGTPS
ncbi:hypothetical protein TPA0905_35370 [Streptomyces olivaceus]|nr:hypothetical protein TPA0905_35370 [Streptomyces olivaceus]